MSAGNEGSQTQGQDAATDGAEGEQQTIPVQRFNEVYKEKEETKRQMAEIQQALSQATAALSAQAAAQAQAQTKAEPEDDLAPEDAAKIDRRMARLMKPLVTELQALRAGVGTAQAAPQIDKVRAKMQKMNNPAVTQKVEEMMANLQAKGLLGSKYTPEEVLAQVVGQIALGDAMDAAQNGSERQAFNGGVTAPLSQGGAGGGPRRKPGQTQQTASVPEMPLEDLTLDQLQQYIAEQEKLHPEGFKF